MSSKWGKRNKDSLVRRVWLKLALRKRIISLEQYRELVKDMKQ